MQLGVRPASGDACLTFALIPPGDGAVSADDGKIVLPVQVRVVTSVEHLKAMYKVIGDTLERLEAGSDELGVLESWRPPTGRIN